MNYVHRMVMQNHKKHPTIRWRWSSVLQSAKVIAGTKDLLAIKQEWNTVLAIPDTSDDELATTFHFDTTSRKKIRGKWPSIILRINDGKKFRGHPLSMSVKTRENITSLSVNTLKRISIASGPDAKELWEKISALMMDSVVKTDWGTIANTLMSDHIPFHLLCGSHTSEVFNKGNMFVMYEIDRITGLRVLLIFLS